MNEKTQANGAEVTKAARARRKAKIAPKAAKKASARSRTVAAKATNVFAFPGFEKFGEELRERIENGSERVREAFGGFGDARETATEALEALRDAYARAGKGLREVNLQAIEFAQKDAHRFFEMVKEVLEADSLRDAFQIQGEFVRAQFERQVKQARELGQMTVDATRDAFDPISETVSDVVGKIRKAA